MGVGARELLTFEFFTVGDINSGVPNGSKSIFGNQLIIINKSYLFVNIDWFHQWLKIDIHQLGNWASME